MKVTIDRYDPDTGERRRDIFDVPEADDRRMTVMRLLEHISENLDPSLAYYRHSVCDHGICGRCLLSVNGKTALACLAVASGCEELHLAPVRGREVVRDLVTRRSGSKD